jgi:hypothetical protein
MKYLSAIKSESSYSFILSVAVGKFDSFSLEDQEVTLIGW